MCRRERRELPCRFFPLSLSLFCLLDLIFLLELHLRPRSFLRASETELALFFFSSKSLAQHEDMPIGTRPEERTTFARNGRGESGERREGIEGHGAMHVPPRNQSTHIPPCSRGYRSLCRGALCKLRDCFEASF